jgi:hypothetical protein
LFYYLSIRLFRACLYPICKYDKFTVLSRYDILSKEKRGGVNVKHQLHLEQSVSLPNSVAPEPEGSSPHSQESAIGPYPGRVESIPHP